MHVRAKICHAISLTRIQPPSWRGTDQKPQENNQIFSIHFIGFLSLPQNTALLYFSSDRRAEKSLGLVVSL